jgi:formate-dependent nitrite reductase membrane component NrfD
MEHEHVWGIPVALDLFFAGLGAAMFLVAVTADLFGGERFRPMRRVGGALAPWPVILGVIMLIADLGNPQRFWEFVLRSDFSLPILNYRPSSVMSTGTWLLVIFTIISLFYCLFSLIRWPFAGDELIRRGIGLVGAPFALLVTIYTGVLISGTSVALWSTPLVPVAFVSSALLMGLAGVVAVLGLRPVLGMRPAEEAVMMTVERAQAALALVVLVLAFVFVAATAGVEGGSRHAASLLWWLFVVVLGSVLPLVHGLLRSKVKIALATPIVAFLAVLGGFFLRYTILMNGQV